MLYYLPLYTWQVHVRCVYDRTACSCAIDPPPEQEGEIREVQFAYWELLDQWINVDGAFDEFDDFTVVIQPHLRDQEAPYDVRCVCFYTCQRFCIQILHIKIKIKLN